MNIIYEYDYIYFYIYSTLFLYVCARLYVHAPVNAYGHMRYMLLHTEEHGTYTLINIVKLNYDCASPKR